MHASRKLRTCTPGFRTWIQWREENRLARRKEEKKNRLPISSWPFKREAVSLFPLASHFLASFDPQCPSLPFFTLLVSHPPLVLPVRYSIRQRCNSFDAPPSPQPPSRSVRIHSEPPALFCFTDQSAENQGSSPAQRPTRRRRPTPRPAARPSRGTRRMITSSSGPGRPASRWPTGSRRPARRCCSSRRVRRRRAGGEAP